MTKIGSATLPAADLRLRATLRRDHTASPKDSANIGRDALAVLHELASTPEKASDALALLHELQVHQIELDLQAEALRESRQALELALEQQVQRYDHQPVACFTLDQDLLVHELNRMAARALGLAQDDACGQALDGFLSPQGGQTMHALIAACRDRDPPVAAATLTLQPRSGEARAFRVSLSPLPDEALFLATFCEEPFADVARQTGG
ncbi:PAS domain-containing protein [Ideonella sp. B7]|uniref:PAS domain-containing protein n=1 Tax=Ideonella benzenivorans TaxID=2831643 RepID=UPI001CEC6DCF|nr:PAS domain-containing protein [Ideonella benzenivorans]MCA6216713.1 PAS domain-containing protein [Ideonella benzenivorans]